MCYIICYFHVILYLMFAGRVYQKIHNSQISRKQSIFKKNVSESL